MNNSYNYPWGETEEERRRRLGLSNTQNTNQTPVNTQSQTQTPVPQFNTTREAVEYAFKKHGVFEEDTQPEPNNSQPVVGYGHVSETHPMAFASQKSNRQYNVSSQQQVPEQKPRYAELRFNGQNLSWIENEKVRKMWPAMSGKEGYQCREYTNVQNKGPIPEGKWSVNQKNAQDYNQLSASNKIASEIGGITKQIGLPIGSWPGGTYAWGNHRIPLEQKETESQNRNNLSIHGGDNLGSAGCIDLAKNMDDFWEWYKKYGKDMNLNVSYPKKCW